MARVALAWEFGASFGHAAAIARLGEALRIRGHEVSLMLRELRPLKVLPEARTMECFQAPIWTVEVALYQSRTYPEILIGAGYRDENALAGLLGGWHALFSGWKPDLVIADYAPTALLAARALGLKRATFGNGFFTPPRSTPLPAFRTDIAGSEQDLLNAEGYVLQVVNGALARIGADPLQRLAQQFETDEDFICTFPELDHYPVRPGAGYWGPRLSIDRGRLADWPEGPGKRVLVYLPSHLPALDELFATLRARGHSVVAYIPRLEESRRKAYATPRIRMSEGPIRLDRLLPRCDLLVSLGGDIATGTLAHGIPQMLFPTQYEQHVTGLRIEALGAGIAVRSRGTAIASSERHGVSEPLDRLLTQPSFTLAARAFRARYPAWTPSETLRRIVVRVEELLQATRP